MLISTVTFIMTFGFKQFQNVPIGPEFFPRYLAGSLFVCSGVLLLRSLRTADAKPAPTLSLRDKGIQRLLAGVAIIVLYALAWEIVGFVLITPAAVFGLMLLLGLRRYPLMVIFSLGVMIVIFSAFRYFLGIDMPLGFLDGII
jgi:putative tricarboxylic transport membrane protein